MPETVAPSPPRPTIASAAGPVTPGNGSPATWLYLRLYPRRLGDLDAAALQVVDPLVRRYGPRLDRWFFLRYVDGGGPHLRLRLLVDQDTADRIVAGLDEWVARLAAAVGPPAARPTPGATVHPVLAPVVPDRDPGIELDLYEPEWGKWGGPPIIGAAEAVFQTSSRVALDLLPRIDGSPSARLALGTRVLVGLLDALELPSDSRRSFLDTHYRWWSAGPDPAQDERLRVTARDLADSVGRAERELGTDQVQAAIATFRTAVIASLPPAAATHKPLFLVFHQLHLMLNRLGVAPTEEALVSVLARTPAGPAT